MIPRWPLATAWIVRFFQDFGWGEAFHRAEPPQVRQPDDRGCLAARGGSLHAASRGRAQGGQQAEFGGVAESAVEHRPLTGDRVRRRG
jgi:hypothetical protein